MREKNRPDKHVTNAEIAIIFCTAGLLVGIFVGVEILRDHSLPASPGRGNTSGFMVNGTLFDFSLAEIPVPGCNGTGPLSQVEFENTTFVIAENKTCGPAGPHLTGSIRGVRGEDFFFNLSSRAVSLIWIAPNSSAGVLWDGNLEVYLLVRAPS